MNFARKTFSKSDTGSVNKMLRIMQVIFIVYTGNGERGAGNGERKSGNDLSAETSTKIQNGGPKNEREKEEDKERNSCLG